MISPTLGAHSVKVCIRKLNLNFTTLKVNFTMAKPQRITSSHTASWKARASFTAINCLAGYLKARNGHEIAFAIMNQNALSGREARAFQDAVCDEVIR